MKASESLKNILEVYEKMKKEKKPYTITVKNKELTVLPGVFSPKYFTDSEWFAEKIPKIVKNKKMLEIGTGTGIVAIFCALEEADVVATDINPEAVKNCKLNSKKLSLDIDVREGDLFEPIRNSEKFDFIFWNHPFIYTKKRPKEMVLRGGLDCMYEGLKKFIKNSKKFLNPNGKVLLGTGSPARIDKIKKFAELYDYEIKFLEKAAISMEKEKHLEVELSIYELKPQNQ